MKCYSMSDIAKQGLEDPTIAGSNRLFMITPYDNNFLKTNIYVLLSESEYEEVVHFRNMVKAAKEFASKEGADLIHSDMKKDILKERQGTHGEFADVAEISQELKNIFRNKEGWVNLTRVQREALDNIIQKAARIFAGDPNFADHWVDIQGYAKLAEKEIRKGENQNGPTSPK